MPTPILTENVAGPFTLTWAPLGSSAATLGLTSKGIRETRRYEGEDIPVDLLGNSMVDSTYLGCQVFLEFELEEANRYAVDLMTNPFINPATANIAGTQLDEGEVGIPGLFYTDVYGSLVATPAFTSTNSAGAQSTPVRTYGICSLAPGWEIGKLFASRRRIIPVKLRVWPYDSGSGRYVWYTKTALS